MAESLERRSVRSFPRTWSPPRYSTTRLPGDSLAQTVLHQSAQTLAYAIYNLAVVLNCPLFVLGGSVGMHPALWKLTQEILLERDKRLQPKLLRSTLGPDAQLNGAIQLALDAAASRVLSGSD